MKKVLNVVVLALLMTISANAQIELVTTAESSKTATKVTVSAKNMSAAADAILGMNFAFFYDAKETKIASVSYAPAQQAGWGVSGNLSESNIAQVNGKVSTDHNMRYEISVFDGNFAGTALAPGQSVDLVVLTFDNTSGGAKGGNLYFANDLEDGGSTVYVNANYEGVPVFFNENIVPLVPSSKTFTAEAEETYINNTSDSNNVKVALYPNPTSDFINMNILSSVDEDAQITIYDNAGKAVYSNVQEVNRGVNTFTIDVADLAAGMYRVAVMNSAIQVTENIVVTK